MPVSTFNDALDVPHNTPIVLSDGKFGLVIRCAPPGEVDVQVPGEPDIRWLRVNTIVELNGGSLVEVSNARLD